MSHWEKGRFQVWNAQQHVFRHSLKDFAYANGRLPTINNVEDAMNYIVAVLYPKYIGTFATKAALPVSSAQNDYAIVSDDGDGKAAGYVWSTIDGLAQWNKRYDVDWSMEAILAETVNHTQYMYVAKYGMSDQDGAGAALVGILGGQHIYGGDVAGQHLTLHANSGDTVGARTGFVQVDDHFRPTVDATLDIGTSSNQFRDLYLSRKATIAATLVLQTGSITDTSGAISFGSNNLTTTGNTTQAIGFFKTRIEAQNAGNTQRLVIAQGSITDTSGSISFGTTNLITSGTLSSGTLTVSSDMIIATGSITSASGAISFGVDNLTTSGTLAAGNTTVPRIDAGNLRLTGNTLSAQNAGGAVTISANGAGHVAITSVLDSIDQNITGILTVSSRIDVNNLRLSGNTISTTDANGDLILSPNGNGGVKVTGVVFPAVDSTQDLGKTAALFRNLYLSGAITNGTAQITMADLLSLRSTPYRDLARTQPAQTGDALFFDAVSGQWLANHPDTEILHSEVSGLTTGDAGHTQFVMLSGRAGGQSIQGGTAASENLVLESTSNGTKGTVQVKDALIGFTTPVFSAGAWNAGVDLGTASKQWRHVFTKGEFFGLRIENFSGLPANSGQNIGRLGYFGSIIQVDNGTSWDQAVMTSQAQSVAGVKTFSSDGFFTSKLGVGSVGGSAVVSLDIGGDFATRKTDVASSATIAALSTTTSFVRITGALTTQIQGIAGGQDGKRVVVFNASSAALTIMNQNAGATAANRIITPSGGALTVSANNAVELIYDAGQSRWVLASSGSGTGGGGGGSIEWIEDDNSPIPSVDFNNRVYAFQSGLAQNLYALVKVPSTYVAGAQVKMRTTFYSPDSSGNGLINAVATLIRTGTDAVSSTTNQRTTTNAAVTLGGGTVNVPQAILLDLTDSSGQINGVAVSAGDLIKVKMTRGTDTGASDLKVPVFGTEVTFS